MRPAALNEVFTPATPVQRRELFVGRAKLLKELSRSLVARGENPVVVGPRGVGKTSLVLQALSGVPHVRIDCSERMEFDAISRSILRELGVDITVTANVETESETHKAGIKVGLDFGRDGTRQWQTTRRGVSESGFTPWDLFCELREIAAGQTIVLDEFDRLDVDAAETRAGFASLLKTISNHDVNVKFMFVGVATSIRKLLGAHASAFRSVIEVKVPPLPAEDVEEFLRTAEDLSGIRFEDKVRSALATDSEGFPYYAHQVALRSAYAAEDRGAEHQQITWNDMEEGIVQATNAAFNHLLAEYRGAVARLTTPERLLLRILLETGPGSSTTLGRLRNKAVEARALSPQNFLAAWEGLSRNRRLVFVQKHATAKETDQARVYFVEPLLAPFLRQRLRIATERQQLDLFE